MQTAKRAIPAGVTRVRIMPAGIVAATAMA
jgi:hypothetical protein